MSCQDIWAQMEQTEKWDEAEGHPHPMAQMPRGIFHPGLSEKGPMWPTSHGTMIHTPSTAKGTACLPEPPQSQV